MISKVAMWTIGSFLLLFLAFPLLVLINVSFTELNYLSFPGEGFTLKWYQKVFEDASYIDSFLYSFKLSGVATICAILIGIPASYALARNNFKGKGFVMNLISSPLLLPQIFLGLALLQFFYYFTNSPQSFLALVVAHIIITLPYVVRTCVNSFIGISPYIEEAGRDLGAGQWKTFFFVTLPLMKSSIVAATLFSFAVSWINVEVTIFLTSADQMALPVKMFNYVQYSIDPMIAAVSAITIYIAFILILIIDMLVGIENIASK
ncbi:ABC transporter permease [Cytobacillus purgationiresistens]|uniref:Spermidine/putrescine transport system permease protein n=1 Tax=Cytobacillus purgationiresistens TaxID=863449 RepID=A0ABU0AKD3_9BACI|nr:ABC transporter permease [Cytobacillus purgationiresistens]MDQ0271726.1 putative spermidine/putrescine transport system permease protein [Cytobacillus purgationiresistens]